VGDDVGAHRRRGSGYVGHSCSVLSAPPEVIRVTVGLNATRTHRAPWSAPRRVREGCRKGMTSSLTWTCPTAGFTKAGNSYCSEHVGDESPHQRGRHKRKKGRSDPHQHDWRDEPKPGRGTATIPGLGRRPPQAWVSGRAVPGRFYAGALWGSSTLGLGCGLVSRARGEACPRRSTMWVPAVTRFR